MGSSYSERLAARSTEEKFIDVDDDDEDESIIIPNAARSAEELIDDEDDDSVNIGEPSISIQPKNKSKKRLAIIISTTYSLKDF
jgi:hypothetical protein